MRVALIAAALGLLILAVGVAPASAQRRAPAREMWGAGLSIGVADPTDPSLDKGLELAGNLERYLTSRVSIRGQLGGAWWNVVGRRRRGPLTPSADWRSHSRRAPPDSGRVATKPDQAHVARLHGWSLRLSRERCSASTSRPTRSSRLSDPIGGSWSCARYASTIARDAGRGGGRAWARSA